MQQVIDLELPSSGGFHSGPSGDREYEEACREAENRVLPPGARILKREFRRERVVRDFVTLTVEVPEPPARWYLLQPDEDETGTWFLRCCHCGAVLDAAERHEVGSCEPGALTGADGLRQEGITDGTP